MKKYSNLRTRIANKKYRKFRDKHYATFLILVTLMFLTIIFLYVRMKFREHEKENAQDKPPVVKKPTPTPPKRKPSDKPQPKKPESDGKPDGDGSGKGDDDDNKSEAGNSNKGDGGHSSHKSDGDGDSHKGDDANSHKGDDGDSYKGDDGDSHKSDNDNGSDKGKDGDNGSDKGKDGDNGSDKGKDGDNGSDKGDGDKGSDKGSDKGEDGVNGSDKGEDGDDNEDNTSEKNEEISGKEMEEKVEELKHNENELYFLKEDEKIIEKQFSEFFGKSLKYYSLLIPNELKKNEDICNKYIELNKIERDINTLVNTITNDLLLAHVEHFSLHQFGVFWLHYITLIENSTILYQEMINIIHKEKKNSCKPSQLYKLYEAVTKNLLILSYKGFYKAKEVLFNKFKHQFKTNYDKIIEHKNIAEFVVNLTQQYEKSITHVLEADYNEVSNKEIIPQIVATNLHLKKIFWCQILTFFFSHFTFNENIEIIGYAKETIDNKYYKKTIEESKMGRFMEAIIEISNDILKPLKELINNPNEPLNDHLIILLGDAIKTGLEDLKE